MGDEVCWRGIERQRLFGPYTYRTVKGKNAGGLFMGYVTIYYNNEFLDTALSKDAAYRRAKEHEASRQRELQSGK